MTVSSNNNGNSDDMAATSPKKVNGSTNTNNGDVDYGKAVVFNACGYDPLKMKALANDDEDGKARMKSYVPLSSFPKDEFLKVVPMTLMEQISAVLTLTFSPPFGIITLQGVVYLIGKFLIGDVGQTFKYYALFILLPLTIIPQPFVPSILSSWIIVQLVKYFSFRMIVEDVDSLSVHPSSKRPRIYVAPPHGVFPYGNIMSMLIHPMMYGTTFRGLASSAALRPPIFKQILRSIGIVDASRNIARSALVDETFEGKPNGSHAIGINTGGVAEVFETNANDECILLKERIGMIKLAIRTGSDLVPCYLLGNTKALSCWAGEGLPFGGKTILEKISRKIGFALILIYGRWGLAIPYRIPIIGIMGKPISTLDVKCENPSMEVVSKYHQMVINETEIMFNKYKHFYGWDDKKIIIK